MKLRPVDCRRAAAAATPLILGLMAGCGTKGTPLEFRVENVVRTNLTQSVSVNGTINPLRLVSVGSQVGGLILELRADFNSKVKEGDIIALIDPSTYEATAKSAKPAATPVVAGISPKAATSGPATSKSPSVTR